MENIIQKLFYSALGFIYLTSQNLRQTIDQLVEDRKISLEEGRKVYESFIQDTEDRREDFEGQLGKIFHKLSDQLDLANKQEVEALKAHIIELEKKVDALKQELLKN